MKMPTIVCLAGVLLCRLATPAFAASCESLAAFALKDTAVTAAQVVPAGRFSLPAEGPTAGRADGPQIKECADQLPVVPSEIAVEFRNLDKFGGSIRHGISFGRVSKSRTADKFWACGSEAGQKLAEETSQGPSRQVGLRPLICPTTQRKKK